MIRRGLIILLPILMLLLSQLACIPPQDCELISKTVAGRVIDADGNPIAGATVSIVNQAKDQSGYEAGRVDRTEITNAEGKFQANVSVFRCDNFNIAVSKDGYMGEHVTYRADVGLLDSLPSEVTIALKKAQ